MAKIYSCHLRVAQLASLGAGAVTLRAFRSRRGRGRGEVSRRKVPRGATKAAAVEKVPFWRKLWRPSRVLFWKFCSAIFGEACQ